MTDLRKRAAKSQLVRTHWPVVARSQDEALRPANSTSGLLNGFAGPQNETLESQDASPQPNSETEKRRYSPPWTLGDWRQAELAREAGWRGFRRRFRVVLRNEGPITSAEQLQNFLGIAELPPTTWSHRILDNDNDPDNPKGEPIQLGIISGFGMAVLRELADGEERNVWDEGEKGSAWEAYSLKEGVERESLGAWMRLRDNGELSGSGYLLQT